MSSAALVQQLMSVRQQLDFASGLLAKPSPEAWTPAATVLETAGTSTTGVAARFSQQAGDAAALEEAWLLRRSFVRTARLLQGAGEFHRNWSQLRGAMTGGYRETGEAAPVLYGHRISVQG